MSKCLECGYYDKEKHYCPFYCQLIRETLNEAISFELEQIKTEIDTMLKSDEVKNDKWANVIINKSYLFKRIINNHIKELKGENNG